MAVPSSGQLRLNADINLELNGSATGTNVSLKDLSNAAGFADPDGMFEFYGYVDAVNPSISSSANTSITSSSMTANGNVTSDGGGTITERGFYFGTSSSFSSNSKFTVSGTTGAYSKSFTGLSGGTTHYATAYAINSIGEVRATTRSSATTTPNISTVLTFNFASLPKSVSAYNYVTGSYDVLFINSSGTTVTLDEGGPRSVGPFNKLTIGTQLWAGTGGSANLPRSFANGYNNGGGGRISMDSGGLTGDIFIVASGSGYSSFSYLIGT